MARAVASVLRPIVFCTAACIVVYFVTQVFIAYAGKVSIGDFRIALGVLTDMKIEIGLTLFLSGSGWAYGLAQRRLRINTISPLKARIADLEGRLDPYRRTSGKTKRPYSREEDD